MLEHTSRYYDTKTGTFIMPDGREVTYLRRRFLPQGDEFQIAMEISIDQGVRLDQITAQTLGDPEQFWRICDANNAMNPADLTDRIGAVLKIPLPKF